VALDSLIELLRNRIDLCVVPQVIYEFWSAATRPVNVNGLGMNPERVVQSVQDLLRDFILLKDERGIYSIWQSLVAAHSVSGKASHDARLVAAMQRHGISHLLTFNGTDFARFTWINVHSPAEVAVGKVPQ
jgi:predicted nucleic acid-binding protein